MQKYTHQEIKEALHQYPLLVINFTKLDGTARALRSTLSPDLIPADLMPKGEKKLNLSEDAIRVYDVENQGWRSFRVDSVTSIKVEAEL